MGSLTVADTTVPNQDETVTESTVPNHHSLSPMGSLTVTDTKDEAVTESTEFEKHQKRYQELIATFPHEKGWRPKSPLIEYGGHWLMPPRVEGCMYAQEFFQARPSDLLICSFPKTGTTWLKALAFAITNRSRLDDSSNPLLKRNPHELVPYIEIEFAFFPHALNKENTLFATHLPYGLLPESVSRSGCKMVYIWRDPKDTFISMFAFYQKQKTDDGSLNSLEECFDMFCRGLASNGPYLDHVLSYWKAYQESPDRILFLKYEKMRADPLLYVKRLSEFMGCEFTADEDKERVVEKVVNLCSFDTLKNLETNKGEKNMGSRPSSFANSAFFRKGEIGDWQNYLTQEMAARIDGLMVEKLKGSGLLEW